MEKLFQVMWRCPYCARKDFAISDFSLSNAQERAVAELKEHKRRSHPIQFEREEDRQRDLGTIQDQFNAAKADEARKKK
jgi:hypothetical protein